MNLIIYSHPDKESFNHAMLEAAKSALEKKGAKYEVIDLYQENYNPVISKEEVHGKVSEQTLKYQEQIKRAKTIIFIFPVFWFRAPAMMEGFLDKTFTAGFAYHYKHLFGVYGMPVRHLTDKKVIAMITHGAPSLPVKTMYVNAVKFRFLLGFLSFCFRLTRCSVYQFWSVPFVSKEKREKYLKKVSRIIGQLD